MRLRSHFFQKSVNSFNIYLSPFRQISGCPPLIIISRSTTNSGNPAPRTINLAAGADCAQQAAQEGANLLAAGSFGGTKNSVNEAALASNTTIG